MSARAAPGPYRLRPRLLRWLAATLVVSALLFGLAGRWDLPGLWRYSGVVSAVALGAVLAVPPGEFGERQRRGPGEVGQITTTLLRFTVLAHVVVAALDVGRFHWSDTIPPGLQLGALAGFALALSFSMWAVVANRFHTHQIRIQTEREHRVVDNGPYRYIRHPSYAGLLVGIPYSALALGSWGALVPAAAAGLVVLWRTAIEDGFLARNLKGYADYAARVGYRLVPGLW